MKKFLKYLTFLSCCTLLMACSNESLSSETSASSESETSPLEEHDVSSREELEDSSKEEPVDEQTRDLLAVAQEVSTEDWELILVNPWHPLPEDYRFEPYVPTGIEGLGGLPIDARIKEPFEALFADAKAAGHDLFLRSAYRSYELQASNYQKTLESYLSEGYTEEEADALTSRYLAQPGYSEHHTGLAIDLTDLDWESRGLGLVPEFDQQASFAWLMDNVADYGFILRYPKGKEEITGISYESWHFRYVGRPAAQYIMKYQITLEEFLTALQETEVKASGSQN